jgi:hypothetical protein
VHGGPAHIGSPELLGISDLDKPDWDDVVHMEPGDVPVFWAFGVTPQQAAMEAGIDLMISHATGPFVRDDVAGARRQVLLVWAAPDGTPTTLRGRVHNVSQLTGATT